MLDQNPFQFAYPWVCQKSWKETSHAKTSSWPWQLIFLFAAVMLSVFTVRLAFCCLSKPIFPLLPLRSGKMGLGKSSKKTGSCHISNTRGKRQHTLCVDCMLPWWGNVDTFTVFACTFNYWECATSNYGLCFPNCFAKYSRKVYTSWAGCWEYPERVQPFCAFLIFEIQWLESA